MAFPKNRRQFLGPFFSRQVFSNPHFYQDNKFNPDTPFYYLGTILLFQKSETIVEPVVTAKNMDAIFKTETKEELTEEEIQKFSVQYHM